MLKNLTQVTTAAAARFGSAPALVFEGRWFSFAEIDALACRLANALKAMGIKPGDRVTLYSGNCWEWIVSYYGILKMGAVVNPLNVMLTPAEVGFVARDCGARAILASAEKGAALLDIKKDTPLEHVILFGADVPAGAKAFEDLTG
ncbi:MAG: AMP-binding protein, partial [Alphaproteobacteria bacterium]